MVTQRKSLLVVLVVVVTAFVGACSGGDDSGDSVGSAGEGDSSGRLLDEQGNLDAPSGDVAFEGAGGNGGTAADVNLTGTDTQIPGTPPHVIKTAEIRIEVPKDEFRESVQESVNIAERSGGFVNSTTINEDSDSGSVTIRVPSESFETALGALEGDRRRQLRDHLGYGRHPGVRRPRSQEAQPRSPGDRTAEPDGRCHRRSRPRSGSSASCSPFNSRSSVSRAASTTWRTRPR